MIIIENKDDNEFFKLCLVRYLNPADYHSARITKAENDLAKAFSTEEILKRHIKDYCKINGKRTIIMPKKSE